MKLIDLCEITEIDNLCKNVIGIKIRCMQGTFNPSDYIELCFYDLVKNTYTIYHNVENCHYTF